MTPSNDAAKRLKQLVEKKQGRLARFHELADEAAHSQWSDVIERAAADNQEHLRLLRGAIADLESQPQSESKKKKTRRLAALILLLLLLDEEW